MKPSRSLDSLVRGVLAAMLLSAPAFSAEQAGKDAHGHDHHHDQTHSPRTMPANARYFSCDLSAYSGQCREYQLVERPTALSEGCESMGGRYREQRCSTDALVGRCLSVAVNDHDPNGVIYDTSYYREPVTHNAWLDEDVKRVCTNLDGRYSSN